MQNQEVKKVLTQLLESVERNESKKKLRESALLHAAIETWENVHKSSHDAGHPPGILLKAAAMTLFGSKIASVDLGKVWNKIVSISRDKAIKILKASKIIELADNTNEAILNLKKQLGLNVEPRLKLAMSESLKKNDSKKKNKEKRSQKK